MTTSCKSINADFDLVYANGGDRVFEGSIYLVNFNISFGIGQNSSNMDLELVVDQCGTDAGIGFTLPDVGRAVNFFSKNSSFYFGGIVNSASYSEAAGGFTYKFKIIDPRKVLDNVSVLLKDYYCNDPNIASLPNFINFAFFQEGITCAVCPPGEDSENWPRIQNCRGFGSSGPGNNSSQNGISLSKVLQRLQVDSIGRIFTTSGADILNLDVSRLIAVTPVWSVTNSSSMSIGAIIDQAAEDAACDIFTTLEGNTITVWPIDRSVPLTSSPIAYLIQQAKSTGTLINSEEGLVELYENSNRIVIGDKVNYLAEVRDQDFDMMLGYLEDGSAVRARGVDFKNVSINTSAINSIVPGIGDSFPISEAEILSAKKQELWLMYGAAIDPNSLSGRIVNILGLNAVVADAVAAFRKLLLPNPVRDGDQGWVVNIAKLRGINQAGAEARNNDLLKFFQCWEWFRNFIQQYYGKKWFVPINEFCIYPGNAPDIIRGDSGPYLLSDAPTSDGYPSSFQFRNSVLGLDLTDKGQIFETSDGKYNGFLKFDNNQLVTIDIHPAEPNANKDFTISNHEIDPNSSVVDGNNLYVEAKSDGEIHRFRGKPQVLIDCNMVNCINRPNIDNGMVAAGVRAMCALFNPAFFANQNGNQQGFNPTQSLNMFQLTPAAARPNSACVAMKSNIYVYGPWASSQNNIGSTEVLVESSLSPWNFGGYGLMNTAGSAIASQAIRLTNKEFSGSVTMAEPPGWNVQYFIQNYSMILDSINVVYGTQGVTSTYSFKTYTPRFGQWGKAISGSLQQTIKDRSASVSRLRELRRKSISEKNGIQAALEKAIIERNPFRREDPNNAENRNSPSIFFIGGFIDNETGNNYSKGGFSFDPVIEVSELDCEDIDSYSETGNYSEPSDGSSTVLRSIHAGIYPQNEFDASFYQDAFYNLGMMSVDGLFSPVSLKGRNGKLSPFSDYKAKGSTGSQSSGSATAKDPLYRSRPVMPPITKNKLDIYQKYINPITSLNILNGWDSRKGSSTKGFNIQYIGYGDTIHEIYGSDTERQDKDDFGFFSLRGPLVLQSWGYDTEGKPIPNIIDSPVNAENGNFESNGTKNKFMTDWLSNPKTWPVGPIDLRWDRDRGVWVSPPSERIVVAQLLQDLDSYKSAKAILLNPTSDQKLFYDDYTIWGDNGENLGTSLKSVEIIIYDYLGRKLCKGSRVYAFYEDKRYIVLESSIVRSDSMVGKNSCCESSSCEDDVCGLSSCFSALGDGPAVIGLDENNCLTLYPFTDCEETSSPPPP